MSLSPESLEIGLRAALGPASIIRVREPLAAKTTLRVGGPADCYVEPADEQELSQVVAFCRRQAVPLFVLGRGSNLLVRDGGVRGVVVCLAGTYFAAIERRGEVLWCGAGARLRAIAAAARDAHFGGFEFMEGIPGSLGGALRMNAGAMGSWTFDVVVSVRGMDLDGQVFEVQREDIEVEYRQCRLFADKIALGAILRGKREALEAIDRRRRECSTRRWSTQPAAASAGCIFKNPASIPAGQLIQELGLKGTRIGDAVVSDVHGNFIINEGRATASEVLKLIELVRERARVERGVYLETEVEVVGQAGT